MAQNLEGVPSVGPFSGVWDIIKLSLNPKWILQWAAIEGKRNAAVMIIDD